MDEVLTGVLSLGDPFIAAKFSQSYCDMGMGPCCLRMSARALKTEKKKQDRLLILHQKDVSLLVPFFSLSAAELS